MHHPRVKPLSRVLGPFLAIVAVAATCSAEDSVWVPAQTGTLIGGGYARSGDSGKVSTVSSAANLSDDPGLRSAVLSLDALAAKTVDGVQLIGTAVSMQTGVPVEF